MRGEVKGKISLAGKKGKFRTWQGSKPVIKCYSLDKLYEERVQCLQECLNMCCSCGQLWPLWWGLLAEQGVSSEEPVNATLPTPSGWGLAWIGRAVEPCGSQGFQKEWECFSPNNGLDRNLRRYTASCLPPGKATLLFLGLLNNTISIPFLRFFSVNFNFFPVNSNFCILPKKKKKCYCEILQGFYMHFESREQ